ncbi:MAG: (d)CMP kinase [Gemmatimonadetes bacterium]|nr:(d)CMP kinase [Gemmatimonadota bacterium]
MSLTESRFVIAIDGPAASGKSSTARAVAVALGFRQADSGALYRAATAARLRVGGDSADWSEESVLDAARSVTVHPADGVFEAWVDGSAADAELRGEEVTANVSLVARMQSVREWVNEKMRECAQIGAIVVDGRDMGTAVFPDAALKIWLVADPEVRAHRRSIELLGRIPSDDELARETGELTARDARDARQTQPADDAVHVDTTRLSPAEQVARIVDLARDRIQRSGSAPSPDAGGR